MAERYYQRALAMDPTSVQTLNNLGYSLLLQGKPALALTFFRDAARIAPDNTVIAANAEQAVTARIEASSQAVAAAPAEPAATRTRDGQGKRVAVSGDPGCPG